MSGMLIPCLSLTDNGEHVGLHAMWVHARLSVHVGPKAYTSSANPAIACPRAGDLYTRLSIGAAWKQPLFCSLAELILSYKIDRY